MRKNLESEPLRQLNIDLNFVLAVPVTLSVPNCSSPAVPLDPSAGWRGRTGCMGNSLSSISQCPGLYLPIPSTIHSQPHLEGHSSFTIYMVSTQHRKQQIPVISHHSIGIECGARGCFRQWERSSCLIGQLLPASSWGAPSQ